MIFPGAAVLVRNFITFQLHALWQIQTTPQLQIVELDITSSIDRSMIDPGKVKLQSWSERWSCELIIWWDFHSMSAAINHTVLHCKPSNEPTQPRDADQIGWNYQLAVWWGILQKLKKIWQFRGSENWEAAPPDPTHSFSFRSFNSSKVLNLWFKWIGLVISLQILHIIPFFWEVLWSTAAHTYIL